MNIIEFKKQKLNPENQNIENNILESLMNIFEKKNKKFFIKPKSNNILKNAKQQHSKDSIFNKVNLILNKLSESNLNNLVIEFIDSINYLDENDFNELLKSFYIKIISEINFIKIYLDFFKIIITLYNKIQNYSIKEFLNFIEIKFKIDYCNFINIPDDYTFLNNMNDEIKILNNLILINKLVEYKFLSDKCLLYCTDILLNQNKCIIDIYKWFEFTKIKLTKNYLENISIILNYNDISTRDKILLQSLYNNNIITDIFKLECYNIINNDIDNIILFINNKCTDAINKNKFCNHLLSYYLLYKDDNIFNIIDQLLINNNILKSHINKGYILLNQHNDEIKSYLINKNII